MKVLCDAHQKLTLSICLQKHPTVVVTLSASSTICSTVTKKLGKSHKVHEITVRYLVHHSTQNTISLTSFQTRPTHTPNSVHHLLRLVSLSLPGPVVEAMVEIVAADARSGLSAVELVLVVGSTTTLTLHDAFSRSRLFWSSARRARAARSCPRNSSMRPWSSCSSPSHWDEPDVEDREEEPDGGESTKLRAGPPFSHNCVGGLPTRPRRRPRSGPDGGACSRYELSVSRLK